MALRSMINIGSGARTRVSSFVAGGVWGCELNTRRGPKIEKEISKNPALDHFPWHTIWGFHKCGYPKFMIQNGRSYENGWFRGTYLRFRTPSGWWLLLEWFFMNLLKANSWYQRRHLPRFVRPRSAAVQGSFCWSLSSWPIQGLSSHWVHKG